MKNKAQGINLSWIVVKNIQEAIRFYTEVVGLELRQFTKEYGWAELAGPEGAILGIAQENLDFNQKAGVNAVVTITVDDLDQARHDFIKRGVNLVGDIMEVPGHVKLQTFQDKDGNTLQLVQILEES